MKIGFYNFYKYFNQNKIFTDIKTPFGENLTGHYVELAKNLSREGIQCSTIDTEDLNEYDKIVFIDYPGMHNSYLRKLVNRKNTELYLILLEPPSIKPDNWMIENQKPFKKIFTFNTQLVDNKKYFLLNNPIRIAYDETKFSNINKKNMAVMIAGNKYSNHANELYSERIKAICWFEKFQPDFFDLYGIDWDRIFLPTLGRVNFLIAHAYKKFSFLPKYRLYDSYRGRVPNKLDVLAKYKFSICFENSIEPGYISEKLFDCFSVATVPIYLGAPDIHRLIPSETYIDMREFETYRDLHDYLKALPKKQYDNYLEAIQAFLKSPAFYPWSVDYFLETIKKEVLNS